MKSALMGILLLSVAGFTTDFDLLLSAGPSYSLGGWGDNLGTGIGGRLEFSRQINRSLKAGAGLEGTAWSSRYDGDASLTMLSPFVSAGYYLRPWGNIFNPGLEVAVGYCRTSLNNRGGADPVTWDPYWRTGIRWDFSLGSGYRGAIGCDYSGVLAKEKTGDAFGLLFAVSKGVSL